MLTTWTRPIKQVYVHGAHGTKCYVLLRGLARVLQPEEDPNTGVVRYVPDMDLGPGDVRVATDIQFHVVRSGSFRAFRS